MFKSPTIVLVLITFIILHTSVPVAESFINLSAVGDFFTNLWDSRADNCFYAARYHGNVSDQFREKVKYWEIEDVQNVSDRRISKDCSGSFYGCQTHACIDGKGNPVFVFNLCASSAAASGENNTGHCSHPELEEFCAMEGGKSKCAICENGMCNEANIEMQSVVGLLDINGTAVVENGTKNAKTGVKSGGNTTDDGNSATTDANENAMTEDDNGAKKVEKSGMTEEEVEEVEEDSAKEEDESVEEAKSDEKSATPDSFMGYIVASSSSSEEVKK
ncbi:hypothetical protein niasHT_037283 [Heterodera trifolii]|uniref:Effector protein n=1 Tax=Heterodera trifolii TaxID=157864 RepID=A0ABD2J2G5_9BILA